MTGPQSQMTGMSDHPPLSTSRGRQGAEPMILSQAYRSCIARVIRSTTCASFSRASPDGCVPIMSYRAVNRGMLGISNCVVRTRRRATGHGDEPGSESEAGPSGRESHGYRSLLSACQLPRTWSRQQTNGAPSLAAAGIRVWLFPTAAGAMCLEAPHTAETEDRGAGNASGLDDQSA